MGRGSFLPFLLACCSCFGSWHFCCQRTKCFLVRQHIHLGGLTKQFFSGRKRSCLKNNRGLAGHSGFSAEPYALFFFFFKSCSLPQFLAWGPGCFPCKVLRPLSQQGCTLLFPGFLPRNYLFKNTVTNVLLEDENLLKKCGFTHWQGEVLL